MPAAEQTTLPAAALTTRQVGDVLLYDSAGVLLLLFSGIIALGLAKLKYDSVQAEACRGDVLVGARDEGEGDKGEEKLSNGEGASEVVRFRRDMKGNCSLCNPTGADANLWWKVGLMAVYGLTFTALILNLKRTYGLFPYPVAVSALNLVPGVLASLVTVFITAFSALPEINWFFGVDVAASFARGGTGGASLGEDLPKNSVRGGPAPSAAHIEEDHVVPRRSSPVVVPRRRDASSPYEGSASTFGERHHAASSTVDSFGSRCPWRSSWYPPASSYSPSILQRRIYYEESEEAPQTNAAGPRRGQNTDREIAAAPEQERLLAGEHSAAAPDHDSGSEQSCPEAAVSDDTVAARDVGDQNPENTTSLTSSLTSAVSRTAVAFPPPIPVDSRGARGGRLNSNIPDLSSPAHQDANRRRTEYFVLSSRSVSSQSPASPVSSIGRGAPMLSPTVGRGRRRPRVRVDSTALRDGPYGLVWSSTATGGTAAGDGGDPAPLGTAQRPLLQAVRSPPVLVAGVLGMISYVFLDLALFYLPTSVFCFCLVCHLLVDTVVFAVARWILVHPTAAFLCWGDRNKNHAGVSGDPLLEAADAISDGSSSVRSLQRKGPRGVSDGSETECPEFSGCEEEDCPYKERRSWWGSIPDVERFAYAVAYGMLGVGLLLCLLSLFAAQAGGGSNRPLVAGLAFMLFGLVARAGRALIQAWVFAREEVFAAYPVAPTVLPAHFEPNRSLPKSSRSSHNPFSPAHRNSSSFSPTGAADARGESGGLASGFFLTPDNCGAPTFLLAAAIVEALTGLLLAMLVHGGIGPSGAWLAVFQHTAYQSELWNCLFTSITLVSCFDALASYLPTAVGPTFFECFGTFRIFAAALIGCLVFRDATSSGAVLGMLLMMQGVGLYYYLLWCDGGVDRGGMHRWEHGNLCGVAIDFDFGPAVFVGGRFLGVSGNVMRQGLVEIHQFVMSSSGQRLHRGVGILNFSALLEKNVILLLQELLC